MEAALKVTEDPYSKSRKTHKESNCIVSIRKSQDTIFHGKLPDRFMMNYLSLLQKQNIVLYAENTHSEMRKFKKNYTCEIQNIQVLESITLLYKIKVQNKDSTKVSGISYYWICSNNYQLYRYEQYGKMKEPIGSFAVFEMNGVANYLPSRDGMVLSYLSNYYEVGTSSGNGVTTYQIYNTEMKIVSNEKFKRIQGVCVPLKSKLDIYKQKENSDPEFWREFNVK